MNPQPGEELLVLSGFLGQRCTTIHHSGNLTQVRNVAIEMSSEIFSIFGAVKMPNVSLI